jgi:hypothetical protein
MAVSLDLHRGIFPAFVVQAVINDQVFPYPQRKKITAGAIDHFVLDILQGKGNPGPQVLSEEGEGNGEHDKEEGEVDEENDMGHDEL